MKNIFKSTLLLACGVLMLTACSDDNDSNPTLLKPSTFTLNTPAYASAGIDLATSKTVNFTWSQPDYGFPAATEYQLEISKDGNYTVSVEEALADETGETMPNYAVLSDYYHTCQAQVPATEIATALENFYKWSETDVPEQVTFFVRASAVTKGTSKIYSNGVQVTVAPYYVELSDAPIVLWYLVGSNFVNANNEGWQNGADKIGSGLVPLLPKVGAEFYKDTGYCTLEYTGHDNHNVGVSEEGYYTITVVTMAQKFTITKLDVVVKTMTQIAMPGAYQDWDPTGNLMDPMRQLGEVHQWFLTGVTYAEATKLKFAANGNWDVNWGSDEFPLGIGTQGGPDIPVKAGTFDIFFNDISGVYYFIEK